MFYLRSRLLKGNKKASATKGNRDPVVKETRKIYIPRYHSSWSYNPLSSCLSTRSSVTGGPDLIYSYINTFNRQLREDLSLHLRNRLAATADSLYAWECIFIPFNACKVYYNHAYAQMSILQVYQTPLFQRLSTNSSTFESSSSLSLDLKENELSTISMSLHFSKAALIAFPAVAAQVPLSTMAIFLF